MSGIIHRELQKYKQVNLFTSIQDVVFQCVLTSKIERPRRLRTIFTMRDKIHSQKRRAEWLRLLFISLSPSSRPL